MGDASFLKTAIPIAIYVTSVVQMKGVISILMAILMIFIFY